MTDISLIGVLLLMAALLGSIFLVSWLDDPIPKSKPKAPVETAPAPKITPPAPKPTKPVKRPTPSKSKPRKVLRRRAKAKAKATTTPFRPKGY